MHNNINIYFYPLQRADKDGRGTTVWPPPVEELQVTTEEEASDPARGRPPRVPLHHIHLHSSSGRRHRRHQPYPVGGVQSRRPTPEPVSRPAVFRSDVEAVLLAGRRCGEVDHGQREAPAEQ